MFQLTKEEFSNLRSQFVISSQGRLRRAAPYAFTEQGVAMLSSLLNNSRAQEKMEVVANCDHLSRLKFSPVLPYAFTEHGAITLTDRSFISIEQEGVCFFEVTICDLKAREQNRRNMVSFAPWREKRFRSLTTAGLQGEKM